MAGINSILFLLTTLSPLTEPPEDVTVPYVRKTNFYPPAPEFIRAWACGPERVFVYCHYDLQRNCTNFEETKGYNTDVVYNADTPDTYKCVPGCVCVEPKIKGLDGTCILPEECPNAKSDWKLRPDTDSDESSLSPDYVLTEDPEDNTETYTEELSTIVKKHSATQKQFFRCQKNEVWTPCSTACPDNCDNYADIRRPCRKICLPFSGCECESGFVRSPSGDCISPDQCPEREKGNDSNRIMESSIFPSLCKENEEFSPFTSWCPDSCDNYQNPHRACNYIKVPGCRCIEGYVRGREGVCVKTEECEEPNETCPENEQYTTCGSSCPKTCDNYDKTVVCPAVCVPGCSCQEPMVRGPDGKCILIDECPPNDEETCSENEEYTSCGSSCPRTCDNYDKTIICPAVCVAGCFCQEPMVRGPDGKCVLIDECPGNEACPENEEYTTCGTACPQTCDNYNETKACPAVCVEGCFCQEPMVRGPDGKCILIEECPGNGEETCPENEQYTRCGSACPQTCDNYNETIVCTDVCVAGCFCQEPMVWGPDGKCILIEECPENEGKDNNRIMESSIFPSLCKDNEEFSPLTSWCPDSCDNYQNPHRACNYIKVPGCRCIEGYVRGREGVCVKTEECEEREETCPENEQYTTCGSACPQTCDNYEKIVLCPDVCVAGCFCQEPMVRGPNGKCVLIDECPENEDKNNNGIVDASILPDSFCKDNEIFSPSSSLCPDNCDNYQNPRRSCNKIRMPGCKCKKGYVRERGDTCVRSEQCGESRPEDCTENEYFDSCGSYCETDCVDYRRHRHSTKCKDQRCKAGCFCKSGFVRGPNWECVAPYVCPTVDIPKLF